MGNVRIEKKRLALLRKIDSILGSSYDLHKVIRKIYKEIGKVMDTSNFYIALYNRLENTIHFEVYTIEGKEYAVSSRPLSKGLTEYVIRSKKPIRINKNLRAFCRRLGIKPIGRNAKSWLGVPMIYKNNVEGVITIQDYKKNNVYSPEDESFLLGIAARAAVVIANTRLIDEEVKRAKELELMNKIAHRLTKSLRIEDICESVTKSIIQQFKNFNVSIFIIENGKVVLKKLSKGFRDQVPRDLSLKLGEGIVGYVAKTGKPLIVNNVARSKRYRAYGQSCTRSEIALPLKVSNKTIGVLNIECNELNAFNKNTQRILELIADRLSAALYNARLYEDATNHAKELAVSFSIAKSLISMLELDDVLHKILEVIRSTFGFANVAILLVDKKKHELYIKAAHGYSQYIMKNVRLKIGKEGVCGHVAATGELFYAPDVSKIPFYVKGKKSIKSEAAIPLKIRGEIIGVLDIESNKLNAFTERDLRIFSVFASQAAVAIENARLFDETKALSLTDALTKIANRRHFDLMLENEWKKARGYSRPLSLAMIDLDNFKHFNDRFGHIAGDKMLIHIARTLRNNVRDTDFVARYGGEEFVIIFPETNKNMAVHVSERIRTEVERAMLLIRGAGRKRLTVSIGVATYPGDAEDFIDLVKVADEALYKAKQHGKNRVETFG
ncbi:MAG TPA: diguanylate cyclase [candidate division WOR-3 bacterium]|uniref:Diguanylate cyclase n=1 Tax=candidate division WOR-3 bacterium TaxID=2052148 RepID=A0A9C9EM40_UNCW3|nr:diguanylate cyclase [candidate division WOR-3 bacterium]